MVERERIHNKMTAITIRSNLDCFFFFKKKAEGPRLKNYVRIVMKKIILECVAREKRSQKVNQMDKQNLSDNNLFEIKQIV